MVKLEASIQRYIGLSSDQKPGPHTDGTSVPPGSSFLETDTGKIYRFSGTETGWVFFQPANEELALLQLIYVELRQLREITQLVNAG